MQGRLPQMVRVAQNGTLSTSANAAATYGCPPSRYAMTKDDLSKGKADTLCRGYGHLSGNTSAALQHLGLYRRRPDYCDDARTPGYGQVDRGRAGSGYHLQ